MLVQVYAVAVDQVDVRAVDEKGRGDVGKYVPGRSFVGRALVVGTDEKEVVRGDVVMGLLDIRKVKKKRFQDLLKMFVKLCIADKLFLLF